MKRLLVIYLLSITGLYFAYSQELRKSLDDYIKKGSAWIDVRLEKSYNGGYHGVYTPKESYKCVITGDTLIGDVKYLKGNNRCWISSYSYDFIELEGCWIIRTDSLNRLWSYNKNKKKEELLLDFSKNFEVGDTIINTDSYWSSKHVISEVDTISFLDGSKGWGSNRKYIYGIGNISCSPFSSGTDAYEDGRAWFFLCFIRDGEFLYIVESLKEILNNDGFVERVMKSFKKDADHILPPTFNDRTDTDAPIYDLTGRRLKSAPEKGIYIQGGKKRVVK